MPTLLRFPILADLNGIEGQEFHSTHWNQEADRTPTYGVLGR